MFWYWGGEEHVKVIDLDDKLCALTGKLGRRRVCWVPGYYIFVSNEWKSFVIIHKSALLPRIDLVTVGITPGIPASMFLEIMTRATRNYAVVWESETRDLL